MPASPPRRPSTIRAGATPHGPVGSAHHGIVDCVIYIDGVGERGRVPLREAIRRVRDTGRGFVWIGLNAPGHDQMEALSRDLGLHELITEDATSGEQRPKLEAYDDALVLNMSTVRYLAHETVTQVSDIVTMGEVMVVLGRDFVVTVRHGDQITPTDVVGESGYSPELFAIGPAAVMHAVADRVVDSYIEAAEGMAADMDELESALFTPRTRVDIEQIYVLKRELLELKHVIGPLTTPLRRLAVDHLDLVPAEARHYFRDVQDHHAQAAAVVATLDEQSTSLVSAAATIVGVQQNTDMRKISAWVAIAAVPTMIAGVYGMNFRHMPELETRYGYFVVLGVMVAICAGLFLLFRRNRWL